VSQVISQAVSEVSLVNQLSQMNHVAVPGCPTTQKHQTNTKPHPNQHQNNNQVHQVSQLNTVTEVSQVRQVNQVS